VLKAKGASRERFAAVTTAPTHAVPAPLRGALERMDEPAETGRQPNLVLAKSTPPWNAGENLPGREARQDDGHRRQHHATFSQASGASS
jgi:hypothetical protein